MKRFRFALCRRGLLRGGMAAALALTLGTLASETHAATFDPFAAASSTRLEAGWFGRIALREAYRPSDRLGRPGRMVLPGDAFGTFEGSAVDKVEVQANVIAPARAHSRTRSPYRPAPRAPWR